MVGQATFKEQNIMSRLINESTHATDDFYIWFKRNYIDKDVSFAEFQSKGYCFLLQEGVIIDYIKSFNEQQSSELISKLLTSYHIMQSKSMRIDFIISCFQIIDDLCSK